MISDRLDSHKVQKRVQPFGLSYKPPIPCLIKVTSSALQLAPLKDSSIGPKNMVGKLKTLTERNLGYASILRAGTDGE